MNKEFQTISIRDLGLAAALVSSGYVMSKTRRDENGRSRFVFEESKELDIAIEDYWADMLRVNARRFFDDLKMLKSRIHSEQ